MCVQVPLEAKRGHQIPWGWTYRQLWVTEMGAGSGTWVPWKNSRLSSLPSHPSSPICDLSMAVIDWQMTCPCNEHPLKIQRPSIILETPLPAYTSLSSPQKRALFWFFFPLAGKINIRLVLVGGGCSSSVSMETDWWSPLWLACFHLRQCL